MPFTFSHPAASVPLARRGLVLSALVVGSMVPDLSYFFRWLPASHLSHTLSGVFLFCVPSGLVVLWLFHTLLKRPLLSLLPVSHQRRLLPLAGHFSFGPLRRFILIVVSLAVGALTHVAWDAFTHSHGWVVRHLFLLSWPLVETAQGTVRLYRVLQHVSTLVGAILLGCWYARWFRRAPAGPVAGWMWFSTTAKTGWVLSIGLGAAALAGVYGFLGIPSILDFHSFRLFVGRAVVAGISILFVEIVIFSAFWHVVELKRQSHVGQDP